MTQKDKEVMYDNVLFDNVFFSPRKLKLEGEAQTELDNDTMALVFPHLRRRNIHGVDKDKPHLIQVPNTEPFFSKQGIEVSKELQ